MRAPAVPCIISPTFGFLLSFPVSAMVVGLLLKSPRGVESRSMGRKLFALTLGTGVVFLIGVPWLGLNLFLVQGKTIGIQALLMMGMVPFLPGAAFKIFLASWLIGPAERALNQIRSR